MTSRDFLKAARQRWLTAKFLLQNGDAVNAKSLGGSAIECSLKALILGTTPDEDRESILKQITSGALMPISERLAGFLIELGHPVPAELAKRLRRSKWAEALRDRSRKRDRGETRAFLKTARKTYDWVREEST